MSGAGQSQVSALSVSLGELPHLPRTQMVELWIKHLGRPPPKSASTPLLLRAVAYAMQEQQLGGLKRQELRVLHKTIESAGASARVPKGLTMRPNGVVSEGISEARAIQRALRAAQIALRPGTRLVREWQGKSHSVDVRADGFAWNGTVYRSLSGVALAITGARWSGNRFFRLDRKSVV